MREMVRILMCSCLLVMLAGCKQEFEDVSSKEEFRVLVGKQYETLVDLRVRGITTDKNYDPSVDYYSVGKIYEVEHYAPEVLTKHTLKAGANFKVLKVVRCSNCPFSKPIKVVIELMSNDLVLDKPVILVRELISSDNDKSINLSTSIFREVKS